MIVTQGGGQQAEPDEAGTMAVDGLRAPGQQVAIETAGQPVPVSVESGSTPSLPEESDAVEAATAAVQDATAPVSPVTPEVVPVATQVTADDLGKHGILEGAISNPAPASDSIPAAQATEPPTVSAVSPGDAVPQEPTIPPQEITAAPVAEPQVATEKPTIAPNLAPEISAVGSDVIGGINTGQPPIVQPEEQHGLTDESVYNLQQRVEQGDLAPENLENALKDLTDARELLMKKREGPVQEVIEIDQVIGGLDNTLAILKALIAQKQLASPEANRAPGV